MYDTVAVPALGDTFTHPPNVRGFDYIAGVPDLQTAWFRNRYYFKNTAGGWTETSPSTDFPESTRWYWNTVTEAGNARAFWTMEDNASLDRNLGMDEQLEAKWNLGFDIGVAQEIIWWVPGTTTERGRDNRFGLHHWNVAVNVQWVPSCPFH